ncbi:CRC domain-containing protein TSO1 [Artemisia annua]|uniref:CRC domain-containing protein TSO1 n=1 Tax=Artemisia annua TaxID=35608 RepID=A0A2U1P7R2_ARTAN|nr:CRC domain-containing protein TSO1 [Artemisia annua]
MVKSDAHEDENQPIPIELKKRKGCNCGRSMCMKNYCLCYQAKVGCGSECRCVSCKNSFGKKGEAGRKAENSNPQILHLDHREGASTTSHSTRNGNSNMFSLDQQTYHNAEIMNQFTPPNTTMLDHSVAMDGPTSSRTNANITYVDSVMVTPIPLFGGTQVNNSNGNPMDTSDKNTPNTTRGSWMHHPNAYRQQ